MENGRQIMATLVERGRGEEIYLVEPKRIGRSPSQSNLLLSANRLVIWSGIEDLPEFILILDQILLFLSSIDSETRYDYEVLWEVSRFCMEDVKTSAVRLRMKKEQDVKQLNARISARSYYLRLKPFWDWKCDYFWSRIQLVLSFRSIS